MTTHERLSETLQKPYSRVLIPQAEGGFSAEILEFPGCFAQGETAEEAYRNLEAAAEVWLLALFAVDRPAPEPLVNYAQKPSRRWPQPPAWHERERGPRQSAVSYVTRADGRILCVWNWKYLGWSMPGGKVEHEEHPDQAQYRELMEETGLDTRERSLLFIASCAFQGPGTESTEVWMYEVTHYEPQPYETEIGCPVTWLTREQLLQTTPFREFYCENFGWPLPEIARTPLRTEDNPALDATDAAHPAWWRGEQHGAEQAAKALSKILFGKHKGRFTNPVVSSVADAMIERMEELKLLRDLNSQQAVLANAYWVAKELLKRLVPIALSGLQHQLEALLSDDPQVKEKLATLNQIRLDLLIFAREHHVSVTA